MIKESTNLPLKKENNKSLNDKINYWDNIYIPPELWHESDDVKTALSKLSEGNYKAAGLSHKKGKKYEFYSIDTSRNRGGRILFIECLVNGKKCLAFVDYLPNHQYKKSKTFNSSVSAELFLKKISELVSDEEKKELLESEDKDWQEISIKMNKKPKIISERFPVYHKKKFLQLNISQENALEKLCISLPEIVTGPPGSGKTLLILEMIKKYKNESGKPVLIVSKSEDLVADIKRQWVEHCLETGEDVSKAVFKTYDQLIEESGKYTGYKKESKEDVISWFENYKNQNKNKNKPGTNISGNNAYQAFRIICGREDYLSLSDDRALFSDPDQRKFVWEAYHEYLKYCKHSKKYHSAFCRLDEHYLNKYGSVYLDEMQDLSLLQIIELINISCDAETKEFFFAGFADQNQSLSDNFSKIPHIRDYIFEFYKKHGKHIDIQPLELSSVERCPEAVVKILNAVLKIKNTITGGKIDKYTAAEVKKEDQGEATGKVYWVNEKDIQAVSEKYKGMVVITQKKYIEEAKKKFGENCLVVTVKQFKGLDAKVVFSYKLIEGEDWKEINKNLKGIELTNTRNRAKEGKGHPEFGRVFNALFTAWSRVIGKDGVLFIHEINSHTENTHIIRNINTLVPREEFKNIPESMPVTTQTEEEIIEEILNHYAKGNKEIKKHAKKRYIEELGHSPEEWEDFKEKHNLVIKKSLKFNEEEARIYQKRGIESLQNQQYIKAAEYLLIAFNCWTVMYKKLQDGGIYSKCNEIRKYQAETTYLLAKAFQGSNDEEYAKRYAFEAIHHYTLINDFNNNYHSSLSIFQNKNCSTNKNNSPPRAFRIKNKIEFLSGQESEKETFAESLVNPAVHFANQFTICVIEGRLNPISFLLNNSNVHFTSEAELPCASNDKNTKIKFIFILLHNKKYDEIKSFINKCASPIDLDMTCPEIYGEKTLGYLLAALQKYDILETAIKNSYRFDPNLKILANSTYGSTSMTLTLQLAIDKQWNLLKLISEHGYPIDLNVSLVNSPIAYKETLAVELCFHKQWTLFLELLEQSESPIDMNTVYGREKDFVSLLINEKKFDIFIKILEKNFEKRNPDETISLLCKHAPNFDKKLLLSFLQKKSPEFLFKLYQKTPEKSNLKQACIQIFNQEGVSKLKENVFDKAIEYFFINVSIKYSLVKQTDNPVQKNTYEKDLAIAYHNLARALEKNEYLNMAYRYFLKSEKTYSKIILEIDNPKEKEKLENDIDKEKKEKEKIFDRMKKNLFDTYPDKNFFNKLTFFSEKERNLFYESMREEENGQFLEKLISFIDQDKSDDEIIKYSESLFEKYPFIFFDINDYCIFNKLIAKKKFDLFLYFSQKSCIPLNFDHEDDGSFLYLLVAHKKWELIENLLTYSKQSVDLDFVWKEDSFLKLYPQTVGCYLCLNKRWNILNKLFSNNKSKIYCTSMISDKIVNLIIQSKQYELFLNIIDNVKSHSETLLTQSINLLSCHTSVIPKSDLQKYLKKQDMAFLKHENIQKLNRNHPLKIAVQTAIKEISKNKSEETSLATLSSQYGIFEPPLHHPTAKADTKPIISKIVQGLNI